VLVESTRSYAGHDNMTIAVVIAQLKTEKKYSSEKVKPPMFDELDNSRLSSHTLFHTAL
jgi:hypothetical protein